MKTLITLTIIATIALAIMGLRVSQNDIDICVKTTNYSAERCMTEIAG